MRIVAGELRGRTIVAPPGTTTRPTTDRVREAVFNSLHSLGVVEGALVVDLYAGSGALGFEALSRGAEHCTFVERDRAALSALEDNRATLGVRPRTRVVNGDPLTMARSIDADLAFADPPYGFAGWPELLHALSPSVGFVVIEAAVALTTMDGWELVRSKRYGRTWVTFVERAAREGSAGGRPLP